MENRYSKYVNTEELRKARKQKGFSLQYMANELGLKSKTAYYNIEVGIAEPKISHINNISKILKMPSRKIFNFKVQ